jgi:hypothetical protein
MMAQTYADIQTQVLFDDFNADKYRSTARQAILDAIGEVARQVRLPANETSQQLTLRKLKGDLQRRNTGRRRQVPGMFATTPGPRFARP